jgi:hypothetical protein
VSEKRSFASVQPCAKYPGLILRYGSDAEEEESHGGHSITWRVRPAGKFKQIKIAIFCEDGSAPSNSCHAHGAIALEGGNPVPRSVVVHYTPSTLHWWGRRRIGRRHGVMCHGMGGVTFMAAQ